MEPPTKQPTKLTGYLMTISGGVLWAAGGACGQRLFQENAVTSNWLVPIRLFIAGLLLLAATRFLAKAPVTSVLRNRRDLKDLILFGLFGASAGQYTYYTCIQYSNAAFATVISYIFPILILLYEMLRNKRLPKLYEVTCVVLVVVGAFACTTHWNFHSLSVSSTAAVVGLLCAAASAYNTIKPQRLIRTYNVMAITGWGMLFGSPVVFFLCRPWRISVLVNLHLFLYMTVVIVGGTVLAFSLFLKGVGIVGNLAGSILGSVEPVASVIIAVLILHVSFTWQDFTGFLLILITIPILALSQRREESISMHQPDLQQTL